MAMKRILSAVLLIVSVALLAAFLFAPAITIRFSQKDVDAAVERLLPYQIEKSFVTVAFSDLFLDLRSDNKVHISTAFSAEGLSLEGRGTADITSGISYREGKFYLSDLSKEDIEFELSANSKDTLSDLNSTVLRFLDREMREAEESDDTERAKSVRNVKAYLTDKLQQDIDTSLDDFLESFPVYDLNRQGAGLKLAALSLEEVRISDENVAATLSFQRFVLRIAAILFSVVSTVVVIGLYSGGWVLFLPRK